jgi:hypothetical protein
MCTIQNKNSLSSLHEIANEKSGKSHSRQASLSSVMDDYSQKDKENMLRRDSGNHSFVFQVMHWSTKSEF